MTTQPEALELASLIDKHYSSQVPMDAAAELRRQHERITELEALLRRSTSVLESPRRDFQVETGLLLDIRAKLGGRG